MRRAGTKGGLDEAGLDDLLKWADRVQAEPEPEPEVVMEDGGGGGGGVGGALGAAELGQPPEGRGSMPAISRLPPKPAPEPGTVDSRGRPLSDLECGIIASAEPAPDQVDLPVAIGKSWWTADSKATRCEMAGCTRTFGKRVRRHHCRKCGKCVCKDCSTYKLMLRHPTEKATSKQVSHDRVCGSCYIAFKQFASPTLGPGGVRLSDSGGAAAERGSMRTSASAGMESPAASFRSDAVDWSDVAEETDAQEAARMLRSGRAY
eukprot:COSAG02_NODE_4148_length_5713_cov_57.342180_3_plen_262_part_00